VTGSVTGFEPFSLPPDTSRYSARRQFEEAVLEALLRSPRVVAFSGGRDSSAILCVATHVARREGLSDPVPATHDFAGCGPSDESTAQELVIRHPGLKDWQRINDVDGFDVLGARAQSGLRRYGLLWLSSSATLLWPS
jgi:asparagine synthetase B (glutamine-hydrolysing)